jgi:hypothetical protein
VPGVSLAGFLRDERSGCELSAYGCAALEFTVLLLRVAAYAALAMCTPAASS